MSQEFLKHLRGDTETSRIIGVHCPKKDSNIFSVAGATFYGFDYYSWLLPLGSGGLKTLTSKEEQNGKYNISKNLSVIALKILETFREENSIPKALEVMVNNCFSLYVKCDESHEIRGVSDCYGSAAAFYDESDYS
jgi:hypothetical protein